MRAISSLTYAVYLLLGATDRAPGAHAAGVDYSQHGANWDVFPRCTSPMQSPIDLKYDVETVDSEENEEIFKHYENLKNQRGISPANMVWYESKHTIQMNLKSYSASYNADGYLPDIYAGTEYANNYFSSKYGVEKYGTWQSFKAAQAHFHAGSEHTIEGQQFDFEMHIVHLPYETRSSEDVKKASNYFETDYYASVMGLIFDTENYSDDVTPEQVEIIDRFFDSLRFDALGRLRDGGTGKGGYSLDLGNEIPLGELMNTVDTMNRWVYKGSLTTPPCNVGDPGLIFWNVINKVWPMKKKHLQQFQMMLGEGKNMINGNYREPQPINGHEVRLLKTMDGKAEEKAGIVVMIAIIFVILIASSVFYLWAVQKSELAAKQKYSIVGQAQPSYPVEKEANNGEFTPRNSITAMLEPENMPGSALKDP